MEIWGSMASVFVLLEAFNRKEAAALDFPCATASFCKEQIPRLKLCKTSAGCHSSRMPMSAQTISPQKVRSLELCRGTAVKRHGQVCADGSLGGLTRIGVDAAGQIDSQHECAAFPLTIHQRTGSQPGRAKAAVKPVPYKASTTASRAVLPALPHRGIW